MAGIPKHLDQKAAKAAMRGKSWGEKDQQRYDVAMGTRKTGQQVRNMRREHIKNKDIGVRDTYAALQEFKEGGGTLGDSAQRQMDSIAKRIARLDARKAAKQTAQTIGSTGKKENPIDSTQKGDNDSTPSNDDIKNETEITNTQTQNVNQDNDIDTTINGNNNTVINNQDNSIRQYGGDNRSFVYNGGKGKYDSPVSAATMGGFYDVDDSPAAQAKFNDMYKDFNRNNSNRFAGQALETLAMFGNMDARSYTDESMENAIGRSTQYSFDRADRQTGHVFGDIWNPNYITENWKMPTPPKPIESKAGELADEAKEDIEDV